MRALTLLLLFVVPLAAADPDILVADFEGDDYGQWKVEGKAFGDKPAKGALPNQMAVSGFKGKGLVNSFAGGDASHGDDGDSRVPRQPAGGYRLRLTTATSFNVMAPARSPSRGRTASCASIRP